MKIKDVTKKPKWWDSCKNVILESKNYHSAIIKKCNGELVLCWNLFNDKTYFEVEENGDEFNNEEELRFHIERMFSWMTEDFQKIIMQLTTKLKKADEVIEKQKIQVKSAKHVIAELVEHLTNFKNRGN